LPEEVVAQSVPGTELYAKVVATESYSYTEIEIYNPSSEPQTFSLFKEGVGVLGLVPQEWAKYVSVGDLSLGVTWGKFSVVGETIRTPADSGVILVSDDGKRILLNPSSELSADELQEIFDEQTSGSLFVGGAEAATSSWKDLVPGESLNECQERQLTECVCVRG